MNYMRNNSYQTAAAAGIDMGLRAYMLRIYNYMAGALALTGLLAYTVSSSPAMINAIFGTPLQWVVLLAPIGVVFFMSFKINTLSFGTAQTLFWVYAGLLGISLSSIFLAYTGASIARAFFVTAAVFGAMSLYGYTTKRDLSGMGSFMMMGLIGVIIASLVNMFLQSSGLQFALSILSVIIFVGLTAWDTQKLREIYYATKGTEMEGKSAIMGALNLYMDFINLFLSILRLMGDRR